MKILYIIIGHLINCLLMTYALQGISKTIFPISWLQSFMITTWVLGMIIIGGITVRHISKR